MHACIYMYMHRIHICMHVSATLKASACYAQIAGYLELYIRPLQIA